VVGFVDMVMNLMIPKRVGNIFFPPAEEGFCSMELVDMIWYGTIWYDMIWCIC